LDAKLLESLRVKGLRGMLLNLRGKKNRPIYQGWDGLARDGKNKNLH